MAPTTTCTYIPRWLFYWGLVTLNKAEEQGDETTDVLSIIPFRHFMICDDNVGRVMHVIFVYGQNYRLMICEQVCYYSSQPTCTKISRRSNLIPSHAINGCLFFIRLVLFNHVYGIINQEYMYTVISSHHALLRCIAHHAHSLHVSPHCLWLKLVV